MKKALTTIGLVALLSFVSIVVIVATVIVKGRGLDQESKRYADGAMVAIASHWNERALLERASPEFIKACPAACTAALFNQAGKLGAMTRYLGSKGQANMNVFIGKGIRVAASYIARATFAHGAASMKLDIVNRDGKWRILGFFVHVDSISSAGTA